MNDPERAALRHLILAGEPTLPSFLNWVADRLVRHGDDPNVDFIIALRRYAKEFESIICPNCSGKGKALYFTELSWSHETRTCHICKGAGVALKEEYK